MSLELSEIKTKHESSYTANVDSREESANDSIFYWITQWDDDILAESQLEYKGEFNILRKAGRKILADLAENPVQVDFEPKNETRDDAAELLDGKYRADCNINTSIQAFNNGELESVVGGVGAWILRAEYASKKIGDNNQTIVRSPLIEANNTVFWDPNAKLLDKSDAWWVSILHAYSGEGYIRLVKETTGEEIDKVDASSFAEPQTSYTFPWIMGTSSKKIHVVEFYHREEIIDKILTLADPFGETIDILDSELAHAMDELLDAGYEIVDTQKVKRDQITRYIASGEKILEESIIACDHIPVVPVYGEHSFVEGEEHWEGITRLTKDPQRLRNFAGSYLGTILSKSPRQKPIFWRDQIAGHEDMYEGSGADNNFAYLIANRFDLNGDELPIGPVGIMPEQPMPTALPLLLQLTKEAVEDVANPGMPQDIADPDLSGKAILALQASIDMQSLVYQMHMRHAKRRDGEIYASMASKIYDVPREVSVQLPDGTRKKVMVMDSQLDAETGEIITINDLHHAEFDVFSTIGPSYQSQKDQTIDRLTEMIATTDPQDPMKNALQLKKLQLMDGVEFDDIREYARKQLILTGIKEPETDEEKKMLQDASKQKDQPDAAMVLAMAEDKKGEAQLLEQQRKGIEMQFDTQDDRAQTAIDSFNAMTKRMEAQIKAQIADADINTRAITDLGSKLDSIAKVLDLEDVTQMSDERLMQQAIGA